MGYGAKSKSRRVADEELGAQPVVGFLNLKVQVKKFNIRTDLLGVLLKCRF